MDPITQGVVGATAGQLASRPRSLRVATLLGIAAGMAPDLDVLIRSSADPLLALEYHRQFTHSLFFIPFGALFCAAILHFLFASKHLSFKQSYMFCLAGYATHALLDACTTYGTLLFWPFSSMRVAWNTVSVVDPIFTLPALILVVVAVLRKSKIWAVLAAAHMVTYLLFGLVQNQRAMTIANELAHSRGHQAVNLGVKPSFANIIVWKSVYEYQGQYYVDAVRSLGCGYVYEGASTIKLDVKAQFPWLDPASQQARDVERFRWFSNDHLGLDPENPNRIIDIRYSLIPNQFGGMWGIELDRSLKNHTHAKYTTDRPQGKDLNSSVETLWAMIKGPLCAEI